MAKCIVYVSRKVTRYETAEIEIEAADEDAAELAAELMHNEGKIELFDSGCTEDTYEVEFHADPISEGKA